MHENKTAFEFTDEDCQRYLENQQTIQNSRIRPEDRSLFQELTNAGSSEKLRAVYEALRKHVS